MTGPEKWPRMEAALGTLFGAVNFTAAGHDVRCIKRPHGEQLVVEVYVDGWIKGEWSKADEAGAPVHSEGWFWRPCRVRAFPLRKHAELKRALGRRKADRMTALKTVAFMPYWNSPRTLVRHLKKHFPDLELIGEGI